MNDPTTKPAAPLCGYDDLERAVRDGSVQQIMLATPDMHGRLQGKIFNAPVFMDRHLADGAEMCGYILTADALMTPQERSELSGWSNGFGDLLFHTDRETARLLPTRPGTALLLADAFHHDGTAVQAAPRHLLAAQIHRLQALGYTVRAGIEAEFLLLQEGASKPLPAWPGNLDYSLDHLPRVAGLFRDLGTSLSEAGISYEAIKTEGAPGQAEITFAYGDVLRAADDYALFRRILRDTARRRGMAVSFMAAPQTGQGSGLHLHLSLWRDDTTPVFAAEVAHAIPPEMRHAIAGLLTALPEMAPLWAPVPNSYKRFQPHSFAPVSYNWGIDNRSCAIRVTGHGRGTHLENRLPGADANPYLALTASLAAMAHGLTDPKPLLPPCDGDAYAHRESAPVQRGLAEALGDFETSKTATDLLGPAAVRHYLLAAQAELDAHDREVTDIERSRAAA
ncbi:glutamine synthetase family protein [Streptomyces griseoviridis]|uniref:glutamine synthetase family protein n=1 Tax=Streptomyces griseoviridis TaxID=45398 RepID=UPI0033D22022